MIRPRTIKANGIKAHGSWRARACATLLWPLASAAMIASASAGAQPASDSAAPNYSLPPGALPAHAPPATPASPSSAPISSLPPANAVDPLTNDPAMAGGPIVGGKHLQPRGKPTEAGNADADALLRQGSRSPAAHSPPVLPRDLYGEPMDGAPDPTHIQ